MDTIDIILNGSELEQLQLFMHGNLGQRITLDGECEEEFKRIIGIEQTNLYKILNMGEANRLVICCI